MRKETEKLFTPRNRNLISVLTECYDRFSPNEKEFMKNRKIQRKNSEIVKQATFTLLI